MSITPGRRPISGLGPVPTQPHDSTVQAWESLYPRLSPRGYYIVDDFYAVKGCEQAITDYRAKHGVTTEIVDLGGTSAMWRER